MPRSTLALTALAITVGSLQAQTRPTMDIESLEVIPGVLVVVEGLTAEAARDGLTSDDVHAEIEDLLADADVTLLTEREWSDLIGNPALQVNFQLLKPSPHLYLYNVTIELRQLTVLVRDSSKGAWTRTWSGGALLGTTPTANLPTLRTEVRTLVQRFIDAYSEAIDRRGRPIPLPERRRIVVAARGV